MSGRKRVVHDIGTRPQFVKAAAMAAYLDEHPSHPRYDTVVVNSGQHYDDLLSDVFLRELPLHRPDHDLAIGEARPSTQFAMILQQLTPLLETLSPDAVVVYGDTTTTLAGALSAAYLELPVVHVEAGERAYRRRRYPEELNRILADHTATLCLTVSERAAARLSSEGVSGERICIVGDVMYDLFLWAAARPSPGTLAPAGPYDLATIHRVENTDDPGTLLGLLQALDAGPRPVRLLVHPRLRQRVAQLDWEPKGSVELADPVGYLQLVQLLRDAHTVVTDSGGLMREAFFAAKPCVIPLVSPPWRELLDAGWAVATGTDHTRLTQLLEVFRIPAGPPPALFGDGRACSHIVDALNSLVEGPPAGREDIWKPQAGSPDGPHRVPGGSR